MGDSATEEPRDEEPATDVREKFPRQFPNFLDVYRRFHKQFSPDVFNRSLCFLASFIFVFLLVLVFSKGVSPPATALPGPIREEAASRRADLSLKSFFVAPASFSSFSVFA